MAKFKPLSVVTIYITWICVACCAENFPVDAEAEEMAVNALFEVSRRMKDDLQLVKVTALQKEQSYVSPINNVAKRVKLDVEARKKSDGVLMACGIVLYERPDGILQFADYEVCEPIAFEVTIDTNCTRSEKKKLSLNIQKLINKNIEEENSLLELSHIKDLEQGATMRKMVSCSKSEEIDGFRFAITIRMKQGNEMQLCSLIVDKQNDGGYELVERICQAVN